MQGISFSSLVKKVKSVVLKPVHVVQDSLADTLIFPSTKKAQHCFSSEFAAYSFLSLEDQAQRVGLSPVIVDYIKKYTPIFYLHKHESYFPISAAHYFTNPSTSIVYQKNHALSASIGAKEVVVPQGQVTMKRIAQLVDERGAYDKDLFIENNSCINFGADPSYNRDVDNNLITPVSLKITQDDNYVWLRYLLLYGFNGPYTSTKAVGFNAHIADLEHVSVVISKNTGMIEKIYFGSHGSSEGMWLQANNKDITYEGTHPVVFVAYSGHGNYPRRGTYLRVFGFANDITDQGIRWLPRLQLIFDRDDVRYNPDTMSWIYFPGAYGSQGVTAAAYQNWWHAEHIGRTYESVLFCEPSNFVEEKACVILKAPRATPPK